MLEYISIGSGSSGNCHCVGYKNTRILVDAGLSGKKITDNLKNIDIDINNIKAMEILGLKKTTYYKLLKEHKNSL